MEALEKARRFLRRLDSKSPGEPLPPRLPSGRVVNVKGRGEMFFREIPADERRPCVLLLHGWTLSADLNWFSSVYDVARLHGRVIAPDIRGHGRGLRSEKPFTLEAASDDVAGLLETLDAGPATIVGYSMGGSLAMLCAHRHPELVSGLVLAATGLQWRASLWERAVWASMAVVEYGLRFGAPKGLAERYLRSAVEQSPALQPYCGWVKAEIRRGDPSDIGWAGKELARFDARTLASTIEVPTAVVITRRDHLIRSAVQARLGQAIEGATTIEIDAGHNAWLVRPDAFGGAIDKALGSVLGRAADPAAARAT